MTISTIIVEAATVHSAIKSAAFFRRDLTERPCSPLFNFVSFNEL